MGIFYTETEMKKIGAVWRRRETVEIEIQWRPIYAVSQAAPSMLTVKEMFSIELNTVCLQK